MMPQRISKKILIYLFFFFTLVTINNTRISSDFYQIKKFNITGLNKIETSKIYDDLIIFKNDNISEKIYSNNFVEKIKIFKLYPSTLNVEIKKTKFLAITKKNNKDYLIGTNGKLIEIKDTISNMPFIFGNINVQNFLKFKKAIDNSNFKFNEIENLYYFKSNRWDVKTKEGLSLKLPSNLTVQKLNLIYEIIQKKNFSGNKTLDFRQSNMMVIDE